MKPETELDDDGYCLRDALSAAGYDNELPSWVHPEDVHIVCEELGLTYHEGDGKTILIPKKSPIIVGHITEREKTLVGYGLGIGAI